MSVMKNIVIPDSLLKQIRDLAEKEGITVDQFISSAAAEKASAWTTIEYLNERARHGSREKFFSALNNVPDIEPAKNDKIK
jgi:hypothetical protein